MRSYYAHLETTKNERNDGISPRPTLRSSAIFPVIQQKGISSRILFMGYWILKRDIKEIRCIITLRNTQGHLIFRDSFLIQEAKTFRIELSEQLEKANIEKNSDFIGSLEVEFFSTHNLFFPFPATVINYYGPLFSSVVHTAQRIYNDFEDREKNCQSAVPESGFNFYLDQKSQPFISLINGSKAVENSTLTLQLINQKKEELTHLIELGPLAPYETHWIFPIEDSKLDCFFENGPATAKIKVEVDWIFPRLIVGNFHTSLPALSITHTYYDCSKATTEGDYWLKELPGWHSAALMIPLILVDDHFTSIYFYPLYSPSHFALDLEIYNSKGIMVGSKPNALIIHSPETGFLPLKLVEICQELQIASEENLGARLIARPLNNSRIPARIKIGLDIGSINSPTTACNICTNLQPFNPLLENKSSSFKWAPLLCDQPKAVLWVMNSSPTVTYVKEAILTATFFREKDAETLIRIYTLPPHGFISIVVESDEELKYFFQDKIGWVTIVTSNPYTTTYYFTENESGVLGGDHGF